MSVSVAIRALRAFCVFRALRGKRAIRVVAQIVNAHEKLGLVLFPASCYTMPKVCCRCNASGRCTNCSSKKSKRKCVNCLPFRQGHCNNPPTRATTTPLLGQPLENQDQSQTDSVDGENRPMSVQTSSPNFTPRHFDTSPVLTIQPPTVMTDDSTSTMDRRTLPLSSQLQSTMKPHHQKTQVKQTNWDHHPSRNTPQPHTQPSHGVTKMARLSPTP